jgi:hypothetical protein
VTGTPTGLQALTGEWSGDYHAHEAGRQGTVVFKLAAGADTARGEVLMFPREESARGENGPPRQPLPQSLSIRFVRAADDTVTGLLDPYIDPDCQCHAETIFAGRLSGDEIEGTYVVQRTGNEPITGTWKVKRRKLDPTR